MDPIVVFTLMTVLLPIIYRPLTLPAGPVRSRKTRPEVELKFEVAVKASTEAFEEMAAQARRAAQATKELTDAFPELVDCPRCGQFCEDDLCDCCRLTELEVPYPQGGPHGRVIVKWRPDDDASRFACFVDPQRAAPLNGIVLGYGHVKHVGGIVNAIYRQFNQIPGNASESYDDGQRHVKTWNGPFDDWQPVEPSPIAVPLREPVRGCPDYVCSCGLLETCSCGAVDV